MNAIQRCLYNKEALEKWCPTCDSLYCWLKDPTNYKKCCDNADHQNDLLSPYFTCYKKPKDKT